MHDGSVLALSIIYVYICGIAARYVFPFFSFFLSEKAFSES